MLLSKFVAVGCMLMPSVATVVTLGPEAVSELQNDNYGQKFRNLKQKTGQVVKHFLGIDRREEFIYYGDYQAYGNVSPSLLDFHILFNPAQEAFLRSNRLIEDGYSMGTTGYTEAVEEAAVAEVNRQPPSRRPRSLQLARSLPT